MKFYKCKGTGLMLVDAFPGQKVEAQEGKGPEEIVPNTQDGAREKHIPVIEVASGYATVKVGEVEHPMLEAHYIEWIALETNQGNYIRHLRPGDKPIACFLLQEGEKVIAAYEQCNLHGLYEGK